MKNMGVSVVLDDQTSKSTCLFSASPQPGMKGTLKPEMPSKPDKGDSESCHPESWPPPQRKVGRRQQIRDK